MGTIVTHPICVLTFTATKSNTRVIAQQSNETNDKNIKVMRPSVNDCSILGATSVEPSGSFVVFFFRFGGSHLHTLTAFRKL